MNSNNDLMDPNWRHSEPSDFEKAWGDFYNNFKGTPYTVHVREFCVEYFTNKIDSLHADLNMAVEALVEADKALTEYSKRVGGMDLNSEIMHEKIKAAIAKGGAE